MGLKETKALKASVNVLEEDIKEVDRLVRNLS